MRAGAPRFTRRPSIVGAASQKNEKNQESVREGSESAREGSPEGAEGVREGSPEGTQESVREDAGRVVDVNVVGTRLVTYLLHL